MFDLKVINSVLVQLEEERGIPRAKVLEAISMALATAYKKEYGKKGQIVRASFDVNTGKTEFFQVKIVVEPSQVIMEDEALAIAEKRKENAVQNLADGPVDERIRYSPEQHIFIDDARKIKKDVKIDDELIFPLETKADYGRIAAQTAKQVIIQKIREAEKVSIVDEYGKREGDIISGTVQRAERGTIFIDLGRATGILPFEEQIPGERFKQGERLRAYLFRVEETPRGIFLRLSRSHPKFLEKLFAIETPEITSGTVEIKGIAREAGSRSKIAVMSHDSHIDAVGSMVGQRGVRVGTVMSELGGEKIDIIEWSEDSRKLIESSLSPAPVSNVVIDETEHSAIVTVAEDQLSLAIGKGGQNVRLAAKLTGWKIDIQGLKKESPPEAKEVVAEKMKEGLPEITTVKSEDVPTEEKPKKEKKVKGEKETEKEA